MATKKKTAKRKAATKKKVLNPALKRARQRDIVPERLIAETKVAIVGTGAVGRNLVLQAVLCGVKNLILIDPDTVDIVNVGVQGFYPDQIGRSKVDAVFEDIIRSEPDMETVVLHKEMWQPSYTADAEVIFCCVDDMVARKDIFESGQGVMFFDSRMSAEITRILTVRRGTQDEEYYASTLYSNQQAQEAPCTAKTTIYCACLTASLLLGQYTKYLRHLDNTDRDFIFDILASDVSDVEAGTGFMETEEDAGDS